MTYRRLGLGLTDSTASGVRSVETLDGHFRLPGFSLVYRVYQQCLLDYQLGMSVVKFHQIFYTTGRYDSVAVTEAPGEQAAPAAGLANAAAGYLYREALRE